MKILESKNYQIYYYIAALVVVSIVSIQSYLLPPKSYDGALEYPRYNNYIIFKNSFEHLKENNDLYVLYEHEHWDLYKYSPTFAVLMAPFWYLPDLAGLFLWNLLNLVVLFYAFAKIQFPTEKMKLLAHLFMLPEIFTSMQNSQSNLLIAGLMILGFVYIQKNQIVQACLMILIAAFIKPFALAAFLVFLFFPGKLKMIGWTFVLTVGLFLLPLLIIPFSALIWQYENWYLMLQMDHSASYGYSVLGWLNTWFSLEPHKLLILLAGVILLLVPFVKRHMYQSEKFQLFMFASVLLWVILFNHKSESPTFIIAVAGIVLWFFTQKSAQHMDLILVILAFIFTCLIASDIFPRTLRKEYAEPYVWKVVPCILIWIKIWFDLLLMKKDEARA